MTSYVIAMSIWETHEKVPMYAYLQREKYIKSQQLGLL